MQRRLIGLLLAGLLGSSSFANGAIVRVGSGAGCDASTIQKGVDIAQAQPGTDTVQLAAGNFFENVTIDGHISRDLIILEGRYDGCSDTQTGPTGLFGLSTSPPALWVTDGARVIVSDMQISNAGQLALSITLPNTDVTLHNAHITQSGLGVLLVDGGALVVDAQSRITNNHNGQRAAGIACFFVADVPSRILVQGLISGNTASSGAGIWASDECQVVLAGAALWNNKATDGGGAIYLDRGAQLTTLPASVNNSFRDNTAERGGAIYAKDAGTSVDLDEADIHDNEATRGGGVYAQSGAQATLRRGVEIFDNIATREGGGVAAYSNSVITLQDGVSVQGNSATDHGGGFYLATGARLSGSANGSRGIEIRGNDAAYGGGLYLTGDGTDAFLFNYHVRGNEARVAGGGAAVRFGAFLEMNRGNGIPCAHPPRCSVLSENVLTQGTDGSALYIDRGASAKLYQTYIEQNRHQMPGATSRVVQTRDDGTTLRLEGIQLWANDATYLIGAADSSSIVAGFITAARNAWTLDENTELPVLGAITSGGGSLTLATSILVDTRGYDGSILNDCLIIDDDTGLATSSTVLVGIDPLLASPATGDLHLRGDSPAIDYCNTTVFAPEDPLDLDLEARGVDHPETPLGLGLYDLGMDETLESPPLFADGFESGNTSAWSNG